ncbi:MAG: hypothetical protein H6774_03380 [Pseudomonadales bacterium]|nr:hypothetical protein [Candidatus Woesebacteria bacterium]MCB9802105.1 hypothetical protein [Pseudomonadales bacterium]
MFSKLVKSISLPPLIRLFLFLVLSVAVLTVYFFNFENRINFGPEQGLSLITSADYIHKDFSLLGLENLQRVTSHGHVLYSGSLYNYSLVPFLVLFNYSPVALTILSALSIIAGSVMTALVAKKVISNTAGMFTFIVSVFSAVYIWHATFIWILNYLPFIGAVSLLCFYYFKEQKNQSLQALFLGILSGVGFNLQYMYVFTALLVVLSILFLSKEKCKHTCVFITAFVIGNAPMILFDIRNDWYHSRLLMQYALDTLHNTGQSKIAYYHFLQFFPLLFIGVGILLERAYKKLPVLAVLLAGAYIWANMLTPLVNYNRPVGMSVTVAELDFAAQLIAAENPEQFNIASHLPFDSSRAYPLRYILEYRYSTTPQGVEEYASSSVVYGLAKNDISLLDAFPWEFSAHNPDKIELIGKFADEYSLYKIE